jgi:protein ImuB
VWLPHWPTERLARSTPGSVPDDRPLVLIEEGVRGLLVRACNSPALAHGIEEGESLADVRARLPHVLSLPADSAADAHALTRLAHWCGRYGAAVALDGSRGLFIDISGVAHLFDGEASLLDDLARRLAVCGITARTGAAATPGAAWALARFTGAAHSARRVVEASRTATVLAELPVAALRLEDVTLRKLHRLGLKRIGQLYELSRAGLKRRLGARDASNDVLRRLDQALGREPEPIVPLRPLPSYVMRRLFAEPLVSSEGLSSTLDQLCGDLCRRLEAEHNGTRRLQLDVFRADGGTLTLRAGLSAPSRSPAHLHRLLVRRLEAIDMGLGIDGLALSARRVEPLGLTQSALSSHELGPRGSASRSFEAPAAQLVDRLASRLGPAAVTRLLPRASHLPERAQVRAVCLEVCADTQAAADIWRVMAERAHPSRPPLLLSEPEPILVVAEIPDGPPARFTWRRMSRRVVRAQGPERIAPEWWREIGTATASRSRDYYSVEDDTGARYWLFREGLYQERGEDDARTPRWFMHGLYG